MNKIIAIIFGCVIGAGIGGGVTYLCLNRHYDRIFESETDTYRSKIDELEKANQDFQKRLANKLEGTKEGFFESNNVVVVDDPDSFDTNDNLYVTPDKKSRQSIRFISKKDYDDDDDYEKELFEYYMLDGTILQNEEVLEVIEFEEVCGNAVIPLLKKDKSLARWSSADDNELYIRNEEYNTDYKIVRYHKAYNPTE